jgi:hypothetical protein
VKGQCAAAGSAAGRRAGGRRGDHRVALPTPRRDLGRPDCRHRYEEAVITAIIAAVLFAIALVLHLAGLSLGPLDSTFFMLGGLIAAALHLAGIGTTYRGRVRR